MSIRNITGNVERVRAPFPTGVAVEVGDLLFLNVSGDALPASSFVWDTNIGTTQAAFVLLFLGTSHVKRLSTQPAQDGMVTTNGVHVYPCEALQSELELGAFIGVAKGTDDVLENQKVVSVATYDLAIGTLARRALAGETELYVEITGSKTGPRRLGKLS